MTRFLSVPLLLICCAGPPAAQGPAPPDLPLSESGRDAATYRLYGSDPAAAALYASFHAAAAEPPHKAEPAPPPAPPPAPAPVPAGPRLKIDAEVKPAGQYATFVPDTDCKAVTYVGLSGVEPIPSAVLLDARLFLLDTRGLQPGRYQFAAVGAAGDRQVRADFAVVVGVPPPPQPPGPGPQPPGPGPSPNPTTEPTVLIVYETAELSKLPRAQLDALYDKQTRDWLDRKAPARWRIWDANVPTANAPPVFQALMQRPRQSLPWLVVAGPDGKPAFEGPLPADAAKLLATLQQYGGQ
jgi:hypothetical protein